MNWYILDYKKKYCMYATVTEFMNNAKQLLINWY